MSDTTKQTKSELKIGPFAGGVSVEIWQNKTRNGRSFRSITISPRRYQVEDGTWRDSQSYREIDIAALILALEKALDHCTTTPLSNPPDVPKADF